ncbi:MAG: hypothetical protein WCV85_05045 [Patescibacteria group bacterium]|jgi:hypothetical protein
MAYKILFNNEEFHFHENDLPCLVHYREKQGGSQFTVTLVADLFLRGSKILFLTAYPMAKDNFVEQVKGEESKIAFITNESQFNTNAQVIILESGNEKLFLKAVEKLGDLHERVVLIKNMEVFSDAVFDACEKLQKSILSGDIDSCVAKKRISHKLYTTTITFSEPETSLPFKTPVLKTYVGYLKTATKEGFVQLEM